MRLFPGYCIDTSALVDLMKRFYPPDIFPSLWEDLKKLISQGNLIAPKQVLKELEKYGDRDDPLLKWAKRNKGMFVDLTEKAQLQSVKEILERFPNLVDSNKEEEADPFVVALAKVEGYSVIASEKIGSIDRPKIPDVCNHYGIKCLSLQEFFREQKWVY